MQEGGKALINIEIHTHNSLEIERKPIICKNVTEIVYGNCMPWDSERPENYEWMGISEDKILTHTYQDPKISMYSFFASNGVFVFSSGQIDYFVITTSS